MATLTPAEATLLNGERARFRVVLDDSCAMQGHRGVYQVVSPDDTVARVRLPAVPDVDGALTVEATVSSSTTRPASSARRRSCRSPSTA